MATCPSMTFLFRMVLIFLFGAAAFPLSVFHCAARTLSVGEPVPVEYTLHYNDVSPVNTSPAVLFAMPPEKDRHKYPGIIAGGILLFGGGMLYFLGHTLAVRTYDDYRESAFTAQTDKLRRQMYIYNGMRVGGGIAGVFGTIILVTSF
jgi:hypothetical protein